jgi:hypothetical protein
VTPHRLLARTHHSSLGYFLFWCGHKQQRNLVSTLPAGGGHFSSCPFTRGVLGVCRVIFLKDFYSEDPLVPSGTNALMVAPGGDGDHPTEVAQEQEADTRSWGEGLTSFTSAVTQGQL